MAIIDGVSAIEVTIWVGGRPAFEYADPDHSNEAGGHGPKMSSKFIQCRNGEEFKIHVRVNSTYDHQQPVPHTLNLAAYIDGQWIRGELCRENNLKNGHFRVDIKERVARTRDGTVVKQAFKFAGVTTRVIELRVFRVEELGSSNFSNGTDTTRLAEVAEKSLKGRAISHGTQFSDDQTSPPGAVNVPRYRDVKRLSTDAGPLAIYRFAYRSREGLYQEAIITQEQNEALKQAEDARRRDSARAQATSAVADRTIRQLREQAVGRLRDLGVEPRRFVGHRERAARARASAQGEEQPRSNGAKHNKREPPVKENGSPVPGESKKRRVEKVIDLTSD
ncbi:hypothetical protein PG985_009177 [Apiospora marii]|uniref:uncharacterized protein n=1 Tax=Apiospora marii TaxID=335849 RepID=UPI00313012CE